MIGSGQPNTTPFVNLTTAAAAATSAATVTKAYKNRALRCMNNENTTSQQATLLHCFASILPTRI